MGFEYSPSFPFLNPLVLVLTHSFGIQEPRNPIQKLGLVLYTHDTLPNAKKEREREREREYV